MNREYLGYREIVALKKHDISKKLDNMKFKRRGDVFYYKKYHIRIGKCKKCDDNCVYLCRLCEICKDRYTCDCLSFVVKKQMCKHVHKVHAIIGHNQKTSKHTHAKSKNKSIDAISSKSISNSMEFTISPITWNHYDRNTPDAFYEQDKIDKIVTSDITMKGQQISNTGIPFESERDLMSYEQLGQREYVLIKQEIEESSKLLSNTKELLNQELQYELPEQYSSIQPPMVTINPPNINEALEKKKALILQQLDVIHGKVKLSKSIISLNRTYEKLKYIDATGDCLPNFNTTKHKINTSMRSKPKTQHMKLEEKYRRKNKGNINNNP